jgi:hypothetical protein
MNMSYIDTRTVSGAENSLSSINGHRTQNMTRVASTHASTRLGVNTRAFVPVARRADCQNTSKPYADWIWGRRRHLGVLRQRGTRVQSRIGLQPGSQKHAPTQAASATRWLPSMCVRMPASVRVALVMMYMLHCCRVFSCTVIARCDTVLVHHQSCAKNTEIRTYTNK